MNNSLQQILTQLISFRTISQDHKANSEALSWITEQIKELPLFVEASSSNGFPSLIITHRKGQIPKLLLAAHIDVVEGSDELFRAKTIDNKLYGRGAFDMKFAVACYLQLFKDLGQDASKYDFGVMLTSDEEIGGTNGVGMLAKKMQSAKVCFLPDGAGNWAFQKSAKGVYQVIVKSNGISGHGAKPWKGENAVHNLIDFLQLVRREFPQEPCGDDDHNHSTITIGTISGGEATNQIAKAAQAALDIRFTAETSLEQVQKKLEAIRADFPNISFETIAVANNHTSDSGNRYQKAFQKILHDDFHITTGFIDAHGASDAHYFLEHNVPVILINPLGGDSHSEEEWIDLESLSTYYQALKQFVVSEFMN